MRHDDEDDEFVPGCVIALCTIGLVCILFAAAWFMAGEITAPVMAEVTIGGKTYVGSYRHGLRELTLEGGSVLYLGKTETYIVKEVDCDH